MKKTSKQWWDSVKADPKKLNSWLVRQYRGEVTASRRIVAFAEKFAPDLMTKRVLDVIAGQERQHAQWVLDLLKTRQLEPDLLGAEERYWRETLPGIESFSSGAAVGAHAEKMRLERIRTIVDDEKAPADIRRTFQKILKDEVFHARAFEEMAGPAAMRSTDVRHQRGRSVLGLVP